jgi:hypothetical protein
MATWTNRPQDEKHLSDISDQVFTAMSKNGPNPSTFVLMNGSQVIGRVAGTSTGNNAGQGGLWQYYGEVRVSPKAGGYDIILDFMELTHVF